MSLPANASTYLSGGSLGFLVPVLAKMISCFSRKPLSFQKSWFIRHMSLALTIPAQLCDFELKAHISIVTPRLFPGRQEDRLRLLHQMIRGRPGNLLVLHSFFEKSREQIVEPPGFDQVGDDDRVARRARSAQRTNPFDIIRV